MQYFINRHKKLTDLITHYRRELIFKAFTSKVTPESNLAEVIHAAWKNRDKMGVSFT